MLVIVRPEKPLQISPVADEEVLLDRDQVVVGEVVEKGGSEGRPGQGQDQQQGAEFAAPE